MTKRESVSLLVLGTTRADTCLEGRSLTAATTVFPTVPRPSSCARLALGMFFPFAAKIGFVRLDRTGEGSHRGKVQSLPYPVGEMPSRLLGHVQVAVELHGGNALEAGREKVRGKQPSLIAEL